VPLDVDMAAIVVMESLGVLSFFGAFLFLRQRQRIRDRHRTFLDALNRRVISERGDGKCYSSEWVLDNIVYKPKKLLNVTPLLLTTLAVLFALLVFGIQPHIVANMISMGYALVVALVGTAILLWTDAFEAYSYATAVFKVPAEQLDKEDQSYIELAKETLEKAFLRFALLGISFALLGPFIPQVFDGVVHLLVLYTTIYFQASEVSFKILAGFGAFIVMILPGLLLFLPEVVGRVVIRGGKLLINKMFKRKAER